MAFEIHDTVMEVDLASPIPPGGTVVFEMAFHSQIPLQTRRSGRDNREGIDFSMAQWYPKMANYDERGWHADPYIGREFYAPFGSFDVRITLPSSYLIGATGELQNPSEIGHGYGETEIPETDSLTWHFRAENVHDFAWAADPDYVHEVVEGENDVTYHLLYQDNVAEEWEKMREWVPQIIEFYSRRFGPYPYPQFTVVQAGDGGMEYPMMTLILGDIPPMGLLGVTAHEAGHMWYYGVLGSNEADYAWMDEGFASFAETEFRAHQTKRPSTHSRSHMGVLQFQHLDLFERMNTPSDLFDTNAGYSVAAYTAGEMLLDMLGYVISDTLRDTFLLEYFDRFRFRHPNPYDVEKVAEDVSGLHLDWYFDQFTNTTWKVDYAVDDVESQRTHDGWESAIELERKGRAVLPVDLRLTLADGSVQWVTVPLSIMHGHKPLPDGWIAADPWEWTSPEYTLRVSLPSAVTKAEI
ncbi:MAG: M1 family metallopeptidase, partial [Rhodothermales bacterium]